MTTFGQILYYIFIFLFVSLVVSLLVLLLLLRNKKLNELNKIKEEKAKEEEVKTIAFVSGFIKGDISPSDKPSKTPVKVTKSDDTAGLSAEDFFSIFFPDPTKDITSALNFVDSLKDTIELSAYITDRVSKQLYGKKVLTKEVLIEMFEKFIKSSKEGVKAFSSFVSRRITSGAKINTSFFRIIKNTNMVAKSSRVARAVMLSKSISNYITVSKKFFKGSTLFQKTFLSRLGMKASSYLQKSAERIASTKAAKGAITSAKNLKGIAAQTAKATIKTSASIARATGGVVKQVVKAGGKTALSAGKAYMSISNAFFWPLTVFEVTNLIVDLNDVGGFQNIGYKATYDVIKNSFISEFNQGLYDQGQVYPYVYGPEIDQDEIFEQIQNAIEISFANNNNDVNDITYKMRKQIDEDLKSGKLTYEDMMNSDELIAKYNMYIDHENLFKQLYSERCKNANGKIVPIDDNFSMYDKKEKYSKKNPIDSDMYFTNSVQSCERLFNEKYSNDKSYKGFSYRQYEIFGDFIDFNKLNDDTYICIFEPNKFIYTKKTIESPMKLVNMSGDAYDIFMNKVIQLNDGTFVGLSEYNLYTCANFSDNSMWEKQTTNDKIRSICQLNDGTFVVIKEDFLLYSKQSLTSDSVKISQITSQLLSITKNNDGTFLIVGKDNIIYTLKDLKSPLVSTTKGSVIHGFQIRDNTYIFLGVDFNLYIKTDLGDGLLDPYENMNPNCTLIKNFSNNDLINDEDADCYIRNNNPVKKMNVCSFKKENCTSKWPIPENDEDYIHHEYKDKIDGIDGGCCVLADSRMRTYCESDEVMINYNGIDKTNSYDMAEGSCLVNKNYCTKKGVGWNEEKKDCEISGWQQFWEFVGGTTFTRKINSCNSTSESDKNNREMKKQGKAIDVTCKEGETIKTNIQDTYILGNNIYTISGKCYYNDCPTGYTFLEPDKRTCIRKDLPPGDWKLKNSANDKDYIDMEYIYKYKPDGGADEINLGAGWDASLSVPSGCLPGYEEHLSLCYINPDPNKKQFSSAWVYRDKCPNPSRDTWLPATSSCHYYRSGYGYWAESESSKKSRCEAANPGKICEKLSWGGIDYFFPKCDDGYRNSYTDNNYCVADGYFYSMSVESVLPNKCPDNRELHGRLCYPKCPTGYERLGSYEYCVSSCPRVQKINYEYKNNTDQDGQTITKSALKTRKECEALCNDISECQGIASYTNGNDPNSRGDCFTLKGLPSTYARQGSVTGSKKVSGVEYMYRPDVEYGSIPMTLGKDEDGNDKKKETNKTIKECEDLCSNIKNCKGIVYYTSNSSDKGDCKLYSDTETLFNRKGSSIAQKLPDYRRFKETCIKPHVDLLKGNASDVGICPAEFPYRQDSACQLSACYKDTKDIVDN
jgi:hypothetical protein